MDEIAMPNQLRTRTPSRVAAFEPPCSASPSHRNVPPYHGPAIARLGDKAVDFRNAVVWTHQSPSQAPLSPFALPFFDVSGYGNLAPFGLMVLKKVLRCVIIAISLTAH